MLLVVKGEEGERASNTFCVLNAMKARRQVRSCISLSSPPSPAHSPRLDPPGPFPYLSEPVSEMPK
jgi:hypothetical protein